MAVITNCTARKRTGDAEPVRFHHDMASSDAHGTVCSWRAALDRQTAQHSARDLYKGRAFAEAQAVATRLNGALLVVSAGLGLVPVDAQVPAYDLTPSDPHGEFSVAMNRAGWTLEDWWAALTVDGGITEAVGQSDVETVLVAIPATYIAMVRADLLRAASVQGRKVFVFTSPVGQTLLGGPLREAAMPSTSDWRVSVTSRALGRISPSVHYATSSQRWNMAVSRLLAVAIW